MNATLILTTTLGLLAFAACDQQGDMASSDCARMMEENPDMMRGMMGSMMADSAMAADMMRMMMENPEMRREMMERMMADPQAHQEMIEMMRGMPGMEGMEGMKGMEGMPGMPRDTAR